MLLKRKFLDLMIPMFWKSYKSSPSPSTKVIFAFILRYPNARRMAWNQIDVFKWQVAFQSKKVSYWSLFTSEGHWLETTRFISLQDTPQQVQKKYALRYDTKEIQHIYQVQTPLRTIFEIQGGNGIYDLKLMYDEKGEMVGQIMG